MVDLNLELPNDFYNEEVRCDYTVTAEMKKVWAVEMDLLKKLLDVCEKYDLKCYADAGTLIGAVRHKGFIPWDDDIDVVMFREDYDKLAAVAENEFQEPYFFQNAYTDETYIKGHAQLRNSETTAILKSQKKNNVKFNCGIFIDIFVLDAVTNNKIKLRIQQVFIEFLRRLMIISLEDNELQTKKERFAKSMLKILKWDKEELFRKLEKILKFTSIKKSEYVAPLGFIFETEKRIRNKHLYDDVVWLEFENMKIPAPAGYHQFLSKRYGDYMKPQKVSTTHGEIFFDTDKPYSHYLGEKSYEEV